MLKLLLQKYVKIPFVIKMLGGFSLGILVGLIFGEDAQVLQPLATILIRLLKLVALPIIFFTIISAVNETNFSELGKKGWRLLWYYLITTAAAMAIGLLLAYFFDPGKGVELPGLETNSVKEWEWATFFTNIIPENIVDGFSSDNLLALMFLGILLGLGIAAMRNSKNKNTQRQGQLLFRAFDSMNTLFFKLMEWFLFYVPIGVFAIAAVNFGSGTFDKITSLLKLIGLFYLGLLIIWVFVYFGFLKLARIPIFNFLKQTKDAYVMGFVTSSSIASLPIAISSAKKAGISPKIVDFAVPLGAVFNSDGGAIRMGISIAFAANIAHMELAPLHFITIVLVGTLLSIGTSGVPAAGLVSFAAILSLFGLPLEIVGIIAGIDAILGMGGTATNVMGDIVGAAYVDKYPKRKLKEN